MTEKYRQVRQRQFNKWLHRPAVVNLTLLLVLSVAPGSALRAQDQPKLSVEVKVVTVYATVRDKHGEIVSNLGKDDFALQEDGRAQAIQYFSHESDLPLTLGLLVDTSQSQRSVLGEERDASYSFLDHLLREDKDNAFVIHYDKEVELLQDLTNSHKKLEAALRMLDEPILQRGSGSSGSSGGDDGGGGNPRGGGRGGAGRAGGAIDALLYDGVYLASNELMAKQHGRKALIVLSDGVDRGSKESLESAIESAKRSDTIVYSILFTGEEQRPFGGGGFGGPRLGGLGGGGRRGGGQRYPQEERPDGKKTLDRISKETGGHLFEVSKKLPIDQIYSQIEEELRNQYSLGYAPDSANGSYGYRKISLTVKQKDMVVQARDGYYAER
jgi:VWFA-related protein